jgi:endonuclease G
MDYYSDGEIAKRLKAVRGKSIQVPGVDLNPWRSAAAVLVAFDPAELNPVGRAPDGTSGLDLLPELVLSSGMGSGSERLWSLTTSARKAQIQRLGSQESVSAALGANRKRPDTSLQRLFDSVITGMPLKPLDEQSSEELAALLVVADWLGGVVITPPLPTLSSVKAALERSSDFSRLRLLVGEALIGREAELNQMRDHLRGRDRTVLFVSGTGGAGKSALLAQCILALVDEAKDPNCWVRVDVADGQVSANEPVTVLRQAAQQLARRDPTIRRLVSSFVEESESRRASRDYGHLESVSVDHEDEIPWAVNRFAEIAERYNSRRRDPRTFAFCVDSFEEAQLLGEPSETSLLTMLVILARVTHVRVIVCGRALPREGALSACAAELRLLPLEDLASADASLLLKAFVHREKNDARIDPESLTRVANAIGGNPLTLKLAARLINEEGIEVVRDEATVKRLSNEAMQARLYSRIVGHIADKDVQRLAIPGLVVRIIDKHVIRDVLAAPCGLGQIDDAHASRLMSSLEREITLVERLPDGVLRYRNDIRRVMLNGMSKAMAGQVNEIHQRAIAHWRSMRGPRALAEELYHMLLSGVSSNEIEQRWMSEFDGELKAALSSAIEELEAGDEARVWLSSKLGVALPEVEQMAMSIDAQESQTAIAATQYLARGEALQALNTVREKLPFRAGSPLFGIRARSLFRLGRTEEAIGAADEGIDLARRAEMATECADLILLRSYILEFSAREREALSELARVEPLVTTEIDRMRVLVRQVRLNRKLGVGSQVLVDKLVRLSAAHEEELVGHPAILREVAAEVGKVAPSILSRALEQFGRVLFGAMKSDELEEMLVRCGAITERERETLSGVTDVKLVELVQSNVEQLIDGTDERAETARGLLVEVFRKAESVTPGDDRKDLVSASTAPGRFRALSRNAHANIVRVLQRWVPLEDLRRIAQFNLDFDVGRLGSALPLEQVAIQLVDVAAAHGHLQRLFQGVLAHSKGEAREEIQRVIDDVENSRARDERPHSRDTRVPRRSIDQGVWQRFIPTTRTRMSMSQNRYLASLQRKLGKIVSSPNLDSLAHSRAVRASEASLEGSRVDSAERVATRQASAEMEASALRKLANGDFDDLSRRERMNLEAIVEEDGRPVVFVIEDQFDTLPSPWTHLNTEPVRTRINSVMPSIGRIEDISGGIPQHIGTGFVVGQNLIMTNRHVAEAFVRGVGRVRNQLSFVPGIDSAIDFRRENELDPNDLSTSLRLTDVVMVHPYWDMALFRVDGLSIASRALKLSVRAPEDLIGREIVAVGYPGRGNDRSRRAVQLERKVFGTTFGVKRLAPGEIEVREKIESFDYVVPAMTHDSSTLAGNSGSAIIDVGTGEVVGLHFAGITLKANYSVPLFELARDPRVVDAGVNFVGSVTSTRDWDRAWRGIESLGDHVSSAAVPVGPVVDSTSAQQTATWTIPIQVSITLGQPIQGASAPASTAPIRARREATFQVPVIHPNLEQRTGYDPSFLELDDGELVPLPGLTSEGEDAVARLTDGSFELKYHRFSVVMNKQRRLALFTASNVSWQSDDKLLPNGHKPTRDELNGFHDDNVQEGWTIDPRIPAGEQLPDKFFINDQGSFDRGHLVRRDDVAWGDSFEDMQRGNGDTFHTTNCSPQVAKFNQATKGVDNWGDLETLIEDETTSERVIVFSGPVLDPSDKRFNGVDSSGPVKVQIPRQFWKIIVAKTEDGPKAFGFVLRQKLTGVPLEFAVPEDWEPYLTPISEIEELLFGLATLDWCKEHDALAP